MNNFCYRTALLWKNFAPLSTRATHTYKFEQIIKLIWRESNWIVRRDWNLQGAAGPDMLHYWCIMPPLIRFGGNARRQLSVVRVLHWIRGCVWQRARHPPRLRGAGAAQCILRVHPSIHSLLARHAHKNFTSTRQTRWKWHGTRMLGRECQGA